MRKFYISADIEGCAGVASPLALAPDRFEWVAARRWMTREALAVADAALAQGFDQVIIADGHGNAHNIDPDLLPDQVRLIRSWPRPLLQMEGVQDPEIEACAFVGYHAGSMAPSGGLAHTYHGGAYRDLRINGVSASEGWLNAAVAGAFGKPVVLITGDSACLEDARRYAPEAEHCIVKDTLGWRTSAGLTPAESCCAIRAAAVQALSRPAPPPFVIEGPISLEIEMTSRTAPEMLAYLPGVSRTGPYCASLTLPDIPAVLRFVSFAMLYSPTGVIAL